MAMAWIWTGMVAASVLYGICSGTIGAVGNTALCETSAPYHLHLSMSLDDKSVDPTDYLPKL